MSQATKSHDLSDDLILDEGGVPFANRPLAEATLLGGGYSRSEYRVVAVHNGFAIQYIPIDKNEISALEGEEYVSIRIEKATDINQEERPTIGVNGSMLQVARGVPITLPKRFYDMLMDTVEERIVVDPITGAQKVVEVRPISITFLGPSTEDKFRACFDVSRVDGTNKRGGRQ